MGFTQRQRTGSDRQLGGSVAGAQKMSARKNGLLASFLSLLLPGLGQLYLGESAHGIALLCIVVGVVLSGALGGSPLTWFLMGIVYLSVLVPSVADAYRVATGRSRAFGGESVAYVVVMLLVAGPFALPLLWRSANFSRIAKVLWTIVIIAVALLFIVTVRYLGEVLKEAITVRAPSG